MEYKLPPLPDLGPEWTAYWTKVVHEKMQAYAIVAIEAQGVPENRCITELKAYAEANPGTYIFPRWDGKRVAKYLASAPPAPQASVVQQEPVAWRTFDGEGGYEYRSFDHNEDYAAEWEKRNPKHAGWVEPLYTHPAQQAKPQPQPLSEDEVWHLAKRVYARSQPYDAPQILLTAKELLTIINCAAHGIQGS